VACSRAGLDESKLWLPTTHGNVIQSYEHQQVRYFNLPGPNKPDWMNILFRWAAFVFLR